MTDISKISYFFPFLFAFFGAEWKTKGKKEKGSKKGGKEKVKGQQARTQRTSTAELNHSPSNTTEAMQFHRVHS